MAPQELRIALASPRAAATREEGLATVARFLAEGAARDAASRPPRFSRMR